MGVLNGSFQFQLVKNRRKVINEKRTTNDESGYEEQHDEEPSYTKKHNIFVDHLIKSDQVKFTDDNIRDHSLTILSAVSNQKNLTLSCEKLFL